MGGAIKCKGHTKLGYDVTRYERPSVTVDIVIFTVQERDLKLLLIQRKMAPYKGRWALPGGFVGMKEALDAAARRELKEETGLDDAFLEQLYTFGNPRRDPRTRVITVAYYALVPCGGPAPQAATDAADARWWSAYDRPRLAFDHDEIIDCALERIRGKIMYGPIAFRLLPEKFTLTELQQVYEIILNRPLDKRNFRKKVLSSQLLKQTRETRVEGRHRPAALFKFAPRKSGRSRE